MSQKEHNFKGELLVWIFKLPGAIRLKHITMHFEGHGKEGFAILGGPQKYGGNRVAPLLKLDFDFYVVSYL